MQTKMKATNVITIAMEEVNGKEFAVNQSMTSDLGWKHYMKKIHQLHSIMICTGSFKCHKKKLQNSKE